MGNPGAPFGGPYGGQGNQGLGGAGLGPQLQNKGPMANSLAQFSVDKKNQPMQAMGSMVRIKQSTMCIPTHYLLSPAYCIMPYLLIFPLSLILSHLYHIFVFLSHFTYREHSRHRQVLVAPQVHLGEEPQGWCPMLRQVWWGLAPRYHQLLPLLERHPRLTLRSES